MIFKGDRQLTPALTDILDDTTPKNNKTFSSNKINSENNILNTKIDSETTRATAKENELENNKLNKTDFNDYLFNGLTAGDGISIERDTSTRNDTRKVKITATGAGGDVTKAYVDAQDNLIRTDLQNEVTRATTKETELETTITNISTVTTGNISTGFQNNFVGHIYWTKVGKVVNLSVELNKRVNDLSSWTWHLLNTLPSNLRPKQRVVCMAFTDYTCNIPADGGGCVNNEIQVSTNGQIHINPRNNIGLLNGDFIFWNITFITN